MTEPLTLEAGDATLTGDLITPADVAGIVVFVHGSGSSRHSPRNQAVARTLQDYRLATVLFDLLTREEEAADATSGQHRFDIPMLTSRLTHVLEQLPTAHRGTRLEGLPVGLFGASTGAAVALLAAARYPDTVGAVVSRGGRPDLAGEALSEVRAPTLLVAGGADETVLELNRQAARSLAAHHEIRTVAGATHLFEEQGALEQVAEWAAEWFTEYLRSQ